ncbi:15014_t:CDS:2 [Entrophospora sp. SA101]|nr:15014_t:CDS:2 [Entrophospora sp. SA101]
MEHKKCTILIQEIPHYNKVDLQYITTTSESYLSSFDIITSLPYNNVHDNNLTAITEFQQETNNPVSQISISNLSSSSSPAQHQETSMQLLDFFSFK